MQIVRKLLDGKSTVLNVIAFFSVSLAVLLILPAIMGGPRPDLLQSVLHAVVIAAVLGAIYALTGRRSGDENESAGGQGATGEVHRTDTDDLTHGLNQRGLTVKMLELMALGERYGNKLSIAIISIDHFGDVVEKFGQEAAEKALVAISDELADSLRMPDVLGRWSEDEFIAILPETPLDGARHIGERLRESVARARFDGKRGVVLSPTASIGVTEFRAGDDLQSLLARANRATDAAKTQGRDRVSSDLAA
jgi:diguanylate cyclase (GGDEF)-like protein